MGELDKIGKTILRKERIHKYKTKTDIISEIIKEHNEVSINKNMKFLLHWWISGDEMSDVQEFKEFLENSEYHIKYYQHENSPNGIQCTLEVTNEILTKDYYYKLYGFLLHHGRDFFCEIFGINMMDLGGDKGWEKFE